MKHYLWMVALFIPLIASAQEIAHTSTLGIDTVPAEFFRKWYHNDDLVYYLEALNDHSIVETTTYGQWWIPERMTFSVEGNPCTSNRFYVDGMRMDDRFQPGSSMYVPNMQQYNLLINTHTSQLFFSLDSSATNYVQLTYNFGQLGNGEPAAGTQAVFNISHRSPMESADLYKHVSARRHVKGAGTLDAAYTFYDKQGNAYRQHVYAGYGQRMITKEDQCGLITDNPFYNAQYYKIQASGELPMKPCKAFSSLNYMLNFSGRGDGGSEYLYNYNEVYNHKNYSGTVYAKRDGLTTGLTWSTNVIRHLEQEFAKNIIDQDGESFYPWIPDGTTHELSWAANYEKTLLDWLSVHVDAYNSLIAFHPEQESFTNTVYLWPPASDNPKDLYTYKWQSKRFVGGLLENVVGLSVHYPLCRVLDLNANLDLTVDGMLLADKSKVTPNFQAGINLNLHPCRWFEMGMSLSHERLPYTMDYLRYFSDDYMNADIYYTGTDQLYATTGGKYHHYEDRLWQTSYLNLDIPIHFRFKSQRGLHEIVLQQSYKRFYHVWHTSYSDNISDMGYYRKHEENGNSIDVFYPIDGEKNYVVGYTEPFGTSFIMNSPYYFSQLTRYTFTGRKVTVGLSWQSMQAAGYTGLGNGANSNTLGVLSESTANPNTVNVVTNQNGDYAGVGRMNLDKGYVCRIYFAYNICQWVQVGMTMKWTDGKPFTSYRYYTDNNRIAILPLSSRGTNPTDGNFGTRHCSKYNIDIHLQGQWNVAGIPMHLTLKCYNVWDFCHDLAEMSFVQDIPGLSRSSMIMDIPVGMMATFAVEL